MSKRTKKTRPTAKPTGITWNSLGGIMFAELSDELYKGADRQKRISASVDPADPDRVTIFVSGGMMSAGSVTFTRSQLRAWVEHLKPLLEAGHHSEHVDIQPAP